MGPQRSNEASKSVQGNRATGPQTEAKEASAQQATKAARDIHLPIRAFMKGKVLAHEHNPLAQAAGSGLT